MMPFPVPHGPSVRGRLRADRAALLLTAVVIFLAALIAAVVPPLVDQAADQAVVDAAREAGDRAYLDVTGGFDPSAPYPPRYRDPNSAEVVAFNGRIAQDLLAPALEPVFRPPVMRAASTMMEVKSGSTPGLYFDMVYADDAAEERGPRVTWVDGVAPDEGAGSVRRTSAPWPVQVGLAEPTAKLLGLGPGDHIRGDSPSLEQVDLVISGIYRPQNPAEDLWQAEPNLAKPDSFTDTRNLTTTYFSVLMSQDSLPDGRLALNADGMSLTGRFLPRIETLTRQNAQSIVDAVIYMESGQATSDQGAPLEYDSSLDTVLGRTLDQISVAISLSTVILAAVLVVLGLALLLTAELLTHRRAAVLAASRRRGAGLPGIALELAVESVLLVVLAGGPGLLLARWIAGDVSIAWAAPVLLLAALCAPVLGVLRAAQATGRKAAPANRSARRNLRITRQLRRIAVEAVVVLIAVAAYIALSQRGVASQESVSATLLPALAPTLIAITAGVLLLRVVPFFLRGSLRLATRLDGSLPILAASRAAATAGRVLPMITVVTTIALGVFILAVRSTAGQEVVVPPDLKDDVQPLASALADGLRDLAAVSAVLMILLALLALVLGASATAPARGETQARLRTLGLTTSDTRWITAGELLPMVLAGAVVGWALGRVLAQRAVDLLSLNVLTGLPENPPLVVPLTTYLPPLLLLITLAAIVAVETSLRRRERLGQVLRA